MTPDELRSLADEATPGPWVIHWYSPDAQGEGVESITMGEDDFISTDGTTYGPKPANARLIALAPDLARLCAEMGEALAIAIEDVLLMDSPEGDSPRNIASNLRAALAKLSELKT